MYIYLIKTANCIVSVTDLTRVYFGMLIDLKRTLKTNKKTKLFTVHVSSHVDLTTSFAELRVEETSMNFIKRNSELRGILFFLLGGLCCAV